MSGKDPVDSPIPRYQQIAQILAARIGAGIYSVGDWMPTEQDLCAEFGTSRYTIREALRRLIAQGLIQRRQGAGTQVVGNAPREAWAQSLRSIRELYDGAAETILDIDDLARILPDPDLAEELGGHPEQGWLRVTGVRRGRGGAALGHVTVYVNGAFDHLADELGRDGRPFYDLIHERTGTVAEEVVQTIEIGTLPDAAAAALGVRPGALGVLITRRYIAAGDRPIQIARNWHAAERFHYAQRIRRDENP